jgi:uncharacterized membrane protein YecN with MAPEG domain
VLGPVPLVVRTCAVGSQYLAFVPVFLMLKTFLSVLKKKIVLVHLLGTAETPPSE